MGELIGIITIICIFALPILVVGYVIVRVTTHNNKERLELARQGIIPPNQTVPSPNKYRSLRNGILCIGIAAGLITGIFLINDQSYIDYIKFLIVCSSTILCMGIAYVIFFLIIRNKDLDNNAE